MVLLTVLLGVLAIVAVLYVETFIFNLAWMLISLAIPLPNIWFWSAFGIVILINLIVGICRKQAKE